MPVSGVDHFHPPGPLHIFLHGSYGNWCYQLGIACLTVINSLLENDSKQIYIYLYMYIVHCLKKILSDILMYSTREHCPSYIFSFFYSINVQKLSLCLTFKHNFASKLVQN